MPNPQDWESIAKALWGLLDDVDTLSDSMKPEVTPYMKAVDRIVRKRHDLLVSDGYVLARPEEYVEAGLCRGCQRPLDPTNVRMADGCPCNSRRGVNHGRVPVTTCTCPRCDAAQTGSVR